MTDADTDTGYAVDRYGAAHHAVLESLTYDLPHEEVRAAIAEYGMEAVAEQYLRSLIADGTLFGDEERARAEEERILDEDPEASPTVHVVTVADVADEFTRLGLTDPRPYEPGVDGFDA